jgi:hypothetical protein
MAESQFHGEVRQRMFQCSATARRVAASNCKGLPEAPLRRGQIAAPKVCFANASM